MTTDIQSAALLAKRIDTARGMMLGPALGDSWTRPHSPGQLRPAGAATQLTCATVHGLIRSLEHAGRNLPLEFEHTTFTALQRWATAQQIPSTRPSRAPEPWQATTPGYTQRRGSAPATERAHEVPHHRRQASPKLLTARGPRRRQLGGLHMSLLGPLSRPAA
jgi:hypothetical protein